MFIQNQTAASLLPVFICFINPAFSQPNLLLNGNFEDINTCKEYKAECGVEAWFYLKDVKVQMIHNEIGTEGANTFAIFYNWNGYKDFTPIIGTILPCTLQKGKEYIFKGWLSARLNSKLNFKPGICTGENFYVPKRPFIKEMKPDSILQVTQVPETPFFEFEYHFVANGKERYLTFGTYISEEALGSKKFFGYQAVSLLIDNFSLTSTDPQETFCAAYTYNKDRIYQYDYRHKDMDYTLYGKGKLPVELSKDEENNITQKETPQPTKLKPDTLKLGDVLFDFNKSNLKPNAEIMLEAFFKNTSDKRSIDSIYIEGHTDSIGSDNKNTILSQKRSESVMNWIINNKVLNGEQITIRAFGRSRPVATNKTPDGRALNRRVEIIIFRRSD